MGRKPVPKPLTLSDSSALSEASPRSGETLQVVSPSADSRSSPRTPRSPFSRFAPKKTQPRPIPPTSNPPGTHSRSIDDFDDEDGDDEASHQYPAITSALHQPVDTPTRPQTQSHRRQPDEAQNHQREGGRPSKSGFFNFTKSSTAKSGHLQHQHHHHNSESIAASMSKGADPTSPTAKPANHSDTSYPGGSVQQSSLSLLSKSDISLTSVGDHETPSTSRDSSKKGKPKPFGIRGRTRSLREKDREGATSSPKDHQTRLQSPATPVEPSKFHPPNQTNHATGIKTAPLGSERSFRDMMTSAVRNRSEDRGPPLPPREPHHKDNHREREPHRPMPQLAFRENAGFFGGLKNSSTRAADMISKGLFGKSMRSGSTTEREPIVDDEHYVLKVINLPLIEQARLTRISKRLEDSRDKTEFWMPAFPWRAIDYLNYKGCDVEGLYRVPGSGPQIKKWQRRFDEEYDVNLFEQNDLYDINIIGSMLKAWLRELPDELFPKEAQDRVSRECAGSETVPQMLIDELSNLSPFNYYLLFAITCHLSLLLAHSDKNKMDFRNLCICFQPCMKIDAFCFKFLVCDWRDCWKGCKQEAKFIEEEYQLFEQPPPKGVPDTRPPAKDDTPAADERAVSSSDSTKQPNVSLEQGQKGRLKKKPLQLLEPNGGSSSASNQTASNNLTIGGERGETSKGSGDLRPLSPIKPLSPLGF